ncbi:SRPBCC domain-containing protein [Paenibacillus sp. XY044]|uniref:SRPBCC family protein n=1 Tax=Paenibacillus sp. XY044 TaxID=2026089 RepID=UPI000B9923C6|nr:SRPBCC domain-containing protein [Paenibacillus sp. XY044]OZB93561.1 ATPase [Paenibacillus sp. XY044]
MSKATSKLAIPGANEAAKPVGLTAAAGFQVGVRRTFPVSREAAWSLLTSPEGMMVWLGELPSLDFKPGSTYTSKEGNHGEIRVVKTGEQIRMTWQRPGWNHPSTVQIRLLVAKTGTTISFHQEKLTDIWQREQMKAYWEEAADRIRQQLAAGESQT